MRIKRSLGQYYTQGYNPFLLAPVQQWVKKKGLLRERVLEPFAGGWHIVRKLQEAKIGKAYDAYDIDPQHEKVRKRDTLSRFPRGYAFCVTNPPWLYKSSAKRRGLSFPATPYDDLYKHALSKCLQHCNYVVALLPASFIHERRLQHRLERYILVHKKLFYDTENPVCIGLFGKGDTPGFSVYYDEKWMGDYKELARKRPKASKNTLKVNDPSGAVGFIGIDNTKEPSMRFCKGEELKDYNIKHSSRSITRVGGIGRVKEKQIKKLNDNLRAYRESTKDLFLTTFKGVRQDGMYRRRMDFKEMKSLMMEVL